MQQHIDKETELKIERAVAKVGTTIALIVFAMLSIFAALVGSAMIFAIVLIWRAINGG